jgi:c(7)-type cytochrome triheme protein
MSVRRQAKLTMILLCCSAAAAAWAVYPNTMSGEQMIEETEAEAIETAQAAARFDHRSAQHARMPCLLCHIRTEGRTTPKMPGHTPCSGCHVQQFADNQNAICTVCHTATSVKPFPPLRSFNTKFDHAAHIRQTNCAACHKPSRRGAGFSVPSRVAAHAACFACHRPQTEIGGRNIGSCGTCHQPGRPVRNSDWSRAYAVNFSHREHLGARINCASCHNVLRGTARGRQVTSPLVSMHFAPPGRASCGACHNNKRAFGPPDFADCKRCHEGKTFRF